MSTTHLGSHQVHWTNISKLTRIESVTDVWNISFILLSRLYSYPWLHTELKEVLKCTIIMHDGDNDYCYKHQMALVNYHEQRSLEYRNLFAKRILCNVFK